MLLNIVTLEYFLYFIIHRSVYFFTFERSHECIKSNIEKRFDVKDTRWRLRYTIKGPTNQRNLFTEKTEIATRGIHGKGDEDSQKITAKTRFHNVIQQTSRYFLAIVTMKRQDAVNVESTREPDEKLSTFWTLVTLWGKNPLQGQDFNFQDHDRFNYGKGISVFVRTSEFAKTFLTMLIRNDVKKFLEKISVKKFAKTEISLFEMSPGGLFFDLFTFSRLRFCA